MIEMAMLRQFVRALDPIRAFVCTEAYTGVRDLAP
jgi:hypothetical protein